MANESSPSSSSSRTELSTYSHQCFPSVETGISQLDHLQARWMQTQAITVGLYWRQKVVRCRLCGGCMFNLHVCINVWMFVWGVRGGSGQALATIGSTCWEKTKKKKREQRALIQNLQRNFHQPQVLCNISNIRLQVTSQKRADSSDV